jgi:hypothetical protein
MRIHYMPQWVPASFEPIKKPVKPRKHFHSEEAAETETNTRSQRPSNIFDEGLEDQCADILA